MVLLLLVPLAVSEYKALSSPIYPQLGYNPQHTGLSPWNGPQNPSLYWSVRVSPQEWQLQGVAVDANGVIYVGSWDGNFYAIRPNGTIKWKLDGILVQGSVPAVPAIGSDGTIYVGSSGSSYLYAINPDGTVKWQFPVQLYSDSSYIFPVVTLGPDGTIYVGGADKYLYAINPDGTLKWKYRAGSSGISAAVDPSTGAVYFTAHDYYIYAFNPDGSLKWKYLLASTPGVPAIGPDSIIYVGDVGGYLYAIRPDGTLKWRYGPVTYSEYGSTYSASMLGLAIDPNGVVYVETDCGWVYAFNPNGTLKWRYSIEGSPAWALNYGTVPVIGRDGIIYVPYYGTAGVYALYPSGALKWAWHDPIGGPTSNPVITPNGLLLVSDEYGYLHAIGTPIKPAPKVSIALAPDYSLWVILLLSLCVAGVAFASRGKIVLGISFIASAVAVYYVILKPFISFQTLIVQAQQLLSSTFAQIPLGPILPAIVTITGIAVLLKILKR